MIVEIIDFYRVKSRSCNFSVLELCGVVPVNWELKPEHPMSDLPPKAGILRLVEEFLLMMQWTLFRQIIKGHSRRK